MHKSCAVDAHTVWQMINRASRETCRMVTITMMKKIALALILHEQCGTSFAAAMHLYCVDNEKAASG
jgi:hypothetical protein